MDPSRPPTSPAPPPPDARPPSPGPPHPVHVVGAGPAVQGVSPHDPGSGHDPAHGAATVREPDAALMHSREAKASVAERNKWAKAQGHKGGGGGRG
jgi:hypothetical protein